jgi:hypothetical protein
MALLLAFPVVFFLFVAPANEAFRAATPASVPPNWTALRVAGKKATASASDCSWLH